MLSQACAVLPVEDMARAKGFYMDKLGMSVLMDTPGGTALQCSDGSVIFLYEHERTRATHTAAAFRVDDLAAEMTALRGKGVVFEEYDQPGVKTVNGVMEMGDMKGAWLKDTEGNIISLNQM